MGISIDCNEESFEGMKGSLELIQKLNFLFVPLTLIHLLSSKVQDHPLLDHHREDFS